MLISVKKTLPFPEIIIIIFYVQLYENQLYMLQRQMMHRYLTVT